MILLSYPSSIVITRDYCIGMSEIYKTDNLTYGNSDVIGNITKCVQVNGTSAYCKIMVKTVKNCEYTVLKCHFSF